MTFHDMRRTLCILLTTFVMLVAIISCTERSALDMKYVTLSLDKDTVHVYKSKHVSVSFTLSSVDDVENIEIRRRMKDGISLTFDVLAKDCFKDMTGKYEYDLLPEDTQPFYFEFIVRGSSGDILGSDNLFVEPRPMIYTSNLKMVAKLTGQLMTPDHKPGILSPNNTRNVDVGGTDLGIMWKMGDNRMGMWFGDTVGSDWTTTDGGGPGNGSNWRSNVLAFSSDMHPEDGITFDAWVTDAYGKARQIIYSAHNTSGTGDYTSIPTAAIRIGNKDYVHYMNVRTWSSPKGWDTNYSSLYVSSDDGQTWRNCHDKVMFSGDSHFAQVCYASNGDGYVYMIGTQSGRFDAAYLARFEESDILEQEKYEYWCREDGWLVNDELSAEPIFESTVSEISLMYHKKYNRWLVTYLKQDNGIVLRHAENIEGPWSDDQNIVSGYEYGGMYSPYMYPFADNGDTLYFTMSMWWYYNVYLMSLDMKYCE